MKKNADLVREIYRWFAQGDAARILSAFERDIEFRLAQGHPYKPDGAPWRGGEAIATHFFQRAGPEWDGWNIRVHDLVEMDDIVVVEARYDGMYKPTRKRLDAQVCHVWRFRDGKVKSFHQYVDTAHLHAVMDG
jgi:uncharacterized protein